MPEDLHQVVLRGGVQPGDLVVVRAAAAGDECVERT
jgi:hypothetical protein